MAISRQITVYYLGYGLHLLFRVFEMSDYYRSPILLLFCWCCTLCFVCKSMMVYFVVCCHTCTCLIYIVNQLQFSTSISVSLWMPFTAMLVNTISVWAFCSFICVIAAILAFQSPSKHSNHFIWWVHFRYKMIWVVVLICVRYNQSSIVFPSFLPFFNICQCLNSHKQHVFYHSRNSMMFIHVQIFIPLVSLTKMDALKIDLKCVDNDILYSLVYFVFGKIENFPWSVSYIKWWRYFNRNIFHSNKNR